VYHNALRASFFDDDYQWLVGSWAFHPSQLTAFAAMNHFYRPVIDLYFAAMTPLLGGSPLLFHAASVGIHAAVVLVVYALATRIAGDRTRGFIAALLFAVQPSDIDAVAWVGALAEAVSALFGCLALLWFLAWRQEHRTRDRLLSVAAYALALLTHESSVMFLPVIVLLDWLRASGTRPRPAPLLPYAATTTVYLAIDLYINSRNYVVSEGRYAIGPHMIRNALDYIDGLYVGRHGALDDTLIVLAVALLLWRGNARVRFATCWMLLALAPFLGFTWGNTSRYGYQAAIGFSMVLAEMARSLGRGAGAVSGRRVGVEAASLAIGAIIAIRFAVFAQGNVTDFAARSQVYPAFLARFREEHRDLPSHSRVTIEPGAARRPYQFVNAAVQWDYRDPTIEIAPY
jgi:hypothetical protein